MRKIKETIFILLLPLMLFLFIFPVAVSAAAGKTSIPRDKMFKAKVLEVLEEETKTLNDGRETTQQNLRLKALTGKYQGEEFVFRGVGKVMVMKSKVYKEGEKVWAAVTYNDQGDSTFYVMDHVRTGAIWWLTGIFVLVLLAVGGFKGFRSLLSLGATFTILIGYIVPSILSGVNPLLPTLVGATGILLLIIYLTEGFDLKSHLAILSTFFSLLVTIILSWVFVEVSRLTGITGEISANLINLGNVQINFQGLLLAGIIIGALGVLDDVVISQISTVEQIMNTDKYQRKWEVFKRSYKVGVSHISSMTNTLFLAYAGASLPLLLLFLSGNSAFTSWVQVVNNEAIATEIIRTLTGSVGLILAVPISTAVAVWWLKTEEEK